MSETTPTALVIADGGLPSILAASIEAERRVVGGGGEVLVMPWPSASELVAEQGAAVASMARFLGQRVVEPCLAPPDAGLALPAGMRESLCLLTALHTAQLAGCPRVVWPVHRHNDDASIAGDLDHIAGAIDRAQLIGRLALLDEAPGGPPPVTIEAPLVDLTDAQLADLVVDLDAPAYLAWWWRTLADRRAESLGAAERRVWLPVLHDAGWVESGPRARVSAAAVHDRAPEPIAE